MHQELVNLISTIAASSDPAAELDRKIVKTDRSSTSISVFVLRLDSGHILNVYTDVPIQKPHAREFIEIPQRYLSHVYVSDLPAFRNAFNVGQQVNQLKSLIPNFLYTYGYIEMGRPVYSGESVIVGVGARHTPHLFTEHLELNTLERVSIYVDVLELQRKDLVVFVLQTLLSLKIAYDKFGYINGDLDGNGLYVHDYGMIASITYPYPDVPGEQIQIASEYLAVIQTTEKSAINGTLDAAKQDYLDLANRIQRIEATSETSLDKWLTAPKIRLGDAMLKWASMIDVYSHGAAIEFLIDRYVQDTDIAVPESMSMEPISVSVPHNSALEKAINDTKEDNVRKVQGKLSNVAAELDPNSTTIRSLTHEIGVICASTRLLLRYKPGYEMSRDIKDLISAANGWARGYRRLHNTETSPYMHMVNPFTICVFDPILPGVDDLVYPDLEEILYARWTLESSDAELYMSGSDIVLSVKGEKTVYRPKDVSTAISRFQQLSTDIHVTGPRSSDKQETFRYPERKDVVYDIATN